MKDEVFITVGELAEHLNCPVLGDKNKKIYGISLYHESTEDTLTYIPPDKIDSIPEINAGAILTRSSIGLQLHRNYIITRYDPYLLLADAIKCFIAKGICNQHSEIDCRISDSAVVSGTVSVGKGTFVGDESVLVSGAVIGENVRIGNNCRIGANTVIGDNVVIDDNVSIGSCCCIGTENFEFCKKNNEWSKIPVIGSVHIHNNVIIGGNVVIEKGTIGTTEIGAFTQIENLVQVGHEVKIGKQCHIVACVAIAGWAEIGDNVEIYGQAAISNRVKVGNNSVLLARAGVDKVIKENSVVSGYPAQNHRQEMQFQAFLRRMFRTNMKERER